jgi:phosphohistidine phosphatase
MQLSLLRHADAAAVASSDDVRPLTEKGMEQAQRVGRFCREHDIIPSLILHSPLKRAAQTAHEVAELTGARLELAPWLASGMSPHAGIEQLKEYRDEPHLMVVGHEPDFSQIIALLLGLPSPTQLHIRKASLTSLVIEVFRAGGARLEWSLPCRLM